MPENHNSENSLPKKYSSPRRNWLVARAEGRPANGSAIGHGRLCSGDTKVVEALPKRRYGEDGPIRGANMKCVSHLLHNPV